MDIPSASAHRTRAWPRPALACLLAAALGNAAAAGRDLTNYSLEQLLDVQVVGASRHAQRLAEAPSAVSVITAADIRNFGYRTLADILKSVRGFYVTNDRQYDHVGVRGFSPAGDYNTRLLVLVDGYRVNDNVYDTGAIGGEFLIDVDLIDRVEIVRGPASSLYGSNAFFGVVNVVTRRGARIDGTEVAAGVGRFGGREARVTYGKRTDSGLDVLLSASGFRTDGPSLHFPEFDSPATNNGDTSGTDYERRRKVFARLGQGGWNLMLAHSWRDKGVGTGAFGTSFVDGGTHIVDETNAIDLSYAHTLEGGTEASGRISYARYRYVGTFVYPPSNIDTGDGSWWNGEVRFTSDLGPHRLTYGADLQVNGRQDQFNYDDVVPRVTFLDDHRSSRRWGAYLQDDFALTPRTTLSAGLRHDRFSDFPATTNPRLALIHALEEGSTLKLLYGSAYRTANVYERFYTYPGQQAGNPGLKPERIQTVEGVWERNFGAELRLTGSLYYYRLADWIMQQLDPTTGLYQFHNFPSPISARGAEFELDRQWASDVRLRASYSAQHSTEGNVDALNIAPRQLVKANLSAPFGAGWRAGVEYQFTSSRATTTGRLGGFGLVNATLVHRLSRNGAEIGLSLYNLLDKAYADPAVDPGVPQREWIAQDGRTWRLRLVVPF